MAEEPDGTAASAAALRPTGDDRVDAVVARLAEVDALAPAEQVPVFEDVHDALRTLLDSVAQPEAAASPATGTPSPARNQPAARTHPAAAGDPRRPGRHG